MAGSYVTVKSSRMLWSGGRHKPRRVAPGKELTIA